MRACLDCRAVADVDDRTCSACGSRALVGFDADGFVLTLSGDAGVPCSVCGTVGEALALRHYRRVVGMFVLDRVYDTSGYMCGECRSAMLRHHVTRTLLLGWWGVLAMWLRNPWALAVNARAVTRPPRRPANWSGMTLDEFDAQRDLLAALDAGELDDWSKCNACGALFPSAQEALDHADQVHVELSWEDAQAAVVRVGDDRAPAPQSPGAS